MNLLLKMCIEIIYNIAKDNMVVKCETDLINDFYYRLQIVKEIKIFKSTGTRLHIDFYM